MPGDLQTRGLRSEGDRGQYSNQLSQLLQRWQHVSLPACLCRFLSIGLNILVFSKTNSELWLSTKDFYLASSSRALSIRPKGLEFKHMRPI